MNKSNAMLFIGLTHLTLKTVLTLVTNNKHSHLHRTTITVQIL